MANDHAELTTRVPASSAYWGGWPTIGLSALILLGVGVAYAAGAVFIGLVGELHIATLLVDLFPILTILFPESFQLPGMFSPPIETDALMHIYWLGALAGLVLIYIVIRRRRGAGFGEYLDLRPIPHLALLPWIGILALYFCLFVVLPELVMAHDGVGSGLIAGGTFFYFVSAVTIAPVFEEILFRGFIFAGLARSKVGMAGAILLTTAMWTAVHRHFTVEWFNEIYGLGVLFGVGLIFALARVRTGSLFAAIALHASWNATLLLVDVMVLKRL
jgi:membrane protease YdiL (CAAX protease family)